MILHAVAHVLGLDDASGPWYLFWSGFFGDLALFGGGLALYHKHNCHERRCWRIARHTHDGSPYCTRHKPAKENR